MNLDKEEEKGPKDQVSNYNPEIDGQVLTDEGCIQARATRSLDYLSHYQIKADLAYDIGPEEPFAVLSSVEPEIVKAGSAMVAQFSIPLASPQEVSGFVVTQLASGTRFDSPLIGLADRSGRAFQCYRHTGGVWCLLMPLSHLLREIEIEEKYKDESRGLRCYLFEPAN